ncbi:MAG: cyclic nucleotide-binding domain-containing protein [Deltaproteobacteria bacterium]|nr:MAG: cyclic nucleotide-binding domain-containing protein [Deltaproteobacteria bacterium]
MKPTALVFLEDADQEALLARAARREVGDGEVIVAQADANRAFYWIREGYVLVQRTVGGVQLSVARMGPGEFFGEMSLLEQAPTSASVVADGPTVVAVVQAEDLQELSTDLPGFETRFYRSLAVVLSKRLRELGGFVAALDRRTAEQHQDLVDRLQPPAPGEHNELLNRAQELRRRLADCEFSATLGGDERANIEAVLEEAASLLKVRGPAGAAVLHRELYTAWMTSRTVAGSLLSAGGSPCGNPTLERVLANHPSGEGFIGPVLDRWVLSRPTLVGMRWAAERVASELAGASVTLLGAVQGAVTTAAIVDASRLSVLDSDEGSLLDLHARAAGRRVLLAHMSAQELAQGRGRLSLLPAEHVVGIGVLERTADADLPGLFKLCRRLVADHGSVWLNAPPTGEPDVGFFRHLLGWECHRRERADLEEAAADAGFAVDIEDHPSQYLLRLTVRE